MKIVIIEDEAPAREKLSRYLQKYDPTFEIVAKLSSIEASTNWFQEKQHVFITFGIATHEKHGF